MVDFAESVPTENPSLKRKLSSYRVLLPVVDFLSQILVYNPDVQVYIS